MGRTVSVVTMVVAICLVAALAPTCFSAESPGARYEKSCSRCHVAFDPRDYSASEWPGIVKTMKAQAGLTEQDIVALTEYLVAESAEGEPAFTTGAQLGGYLYTEYFQTPEEVSNFDIHYLAVYISGWVTDSFYYFGEFELEHGGVGGDNTFVEQAYLDYWVHPNVAVRTGAMLTPFNRFDEFHDPLSNFTVTRPQVSREIGVSAWKDVGVNLHGYVTLSDRTSLNFDLYTINGLGDGANLRGSRQYRDNNEDRAVGGRVAVVYDHALELGGSAYGGAWDAEGEQELRMYGVHSLFSTSFADFYGEFAHAVSENPGPVEDGEMSGYFIQASRLLGSRFRSTVRYGMLDYADPGDQLGRDPAKGSADLTELVVALAYYPAPDVVFKIEYAFFDERGDAAERDNDQLGLQAAVRF